MPSLCKTPLSKTLGIGLGAALLTGEAVIAVLALWFPHENQMYQEFYIRHTRECWLSPSDEAAAIATLRQPETDIATIDPKAGCYAFVHGWYYGPPFGDTTQTVTAWLDLPPPGGAKALELTLADTSTVSTQVIWVRFKGQQATRLTLPPGQVPVALQLALPPNAGGNLQLRIDRPDEPDGNPMAVLRLRWMQ